LPDIFAARQFRAYIDRNHERVTRVLTQPYISGGPQADEPPDDPGWSETIVEN
jgi:hypothetical protein